MSLTQTENSLGLTESGVETPGEAAAEIKGKRKKAGLLWWFACAWLGIIVLMVVFADLLPNPYDQPVPDASAHESPFSSWPEFLGTDYLGRSTLSRIAAGARTSVTVATIPVASGILIGGLLGLVSAYFRGTTEAVIDIFADALLAFPPLLLLLMMSSVLYPPSVWTITLGLAILTVPGFYRLTKANAIAQSKREYVVVAKAMGARPGRIMFKELMPNTVATILSYAVIVMAVMIVAEGSLSFLGVGVPDPEPSWGGMVYKEKDNLEDYPGQVFVPCAVLFLTVFSLNVIGDRLRSKFDVRDSNL
ncbi:ABC transporter permease [Yinghuangia seranimata]|uniref:ABC transporter permease n=1 Tax=Yinghuangia seranimata TaxID=408067 RepID=UPI00248CCF27|nr:ABC transporter permease [Yinghuangia seranimata]MDI2129282.1 ABC transporter permease [Yinghuangia seranimata]